MKTIKKILNGIVTGITAIGGIFIALAWIITFLSVTFGLAIWTTQWFFNLI